MIECRTNERTEPGGGGCEAGACLRVAGGGRVGKDDCTVTVLAVSLSFSQAVHVVSNGGWPRQEVCVVRSETLQDVKHGCMCVCGGIRQCVYVWGGISQCMCVGGYQPVCVCVCVCGGGVGGL